MKSLIHSVSAFMFVLLALVVMSFPTHANAMAVVESCLACNSVQMPPGAVSALSGTEYIGKVTKTSGNDRANSVHSPGVIKYMAAGGDFDPTDTLVAATENTKTMPAIHQNLILANRLLI